MLVVVQTPHTSIDLSFVTVNDDRILPQNVYQIFETNMNTNIKHMHLPYTKD